MKDDLFQEGQPLPAGAGPQGGGELLSAEMTPSGAAPGKTMQEFDEEAVTPEEQGIYDQFVLRAQEYMTKSPEVVVDKMNRSDVPVFQNVGKTAVMIGQGVIKTAEAAGQEISPDIIFAGGQEIVAMLMELGDSAGIWPFKQNSKKYEEAQAMAFMHGAEIIGKQTLEGPNAAAMTEEAGSELALQIAGENERGEVAPGFYEGLQSNVAGGVKRAISGGM